MGHEEERVMGTDLIHKWLVKEVRSSYAEVEHINFLENGIVKCI